MGKIKNFLFDKKIGFGYFQKLGFYNKTPDEKLLKKKFKIFMGQELNLENPQTFNEKLQWLKLYDRKPIYTTMVDKYSAKRFVADKIGEEYVIPTLGVYEKFEDIDFDKLPNQFVLKTTHDSGSIVICKDKSTFDIEKARKKLNKSLKRDYYLSHREWPYKDVPRKIIAEKFMKDDVHSALPVYKFFCFNGEPLFLQAIQNDKCKNESIDYFDVEWNKLDLRQNFPNSERQLEKPKELEEMLNIVKKLAQEKKNFIRVDLYTIKGKIYFSEFTFFSDAGFVSFSPNEWDKKLGDLIDLTK